MKSTWCLALESSTAHGGAALLRDGEIIEIVRLEEGLRHGRELVPAAQTLQQSHNLTPRDIGGIGVSIGPGSYTGIRIGVMAAKSLAYAAQCQLAGISSLAAMALTARLENAAAVGDVVCVVQDARRDEVYAAIYRLTEQGVEPIVTDAALAPEEARARVEQAKTTAPRVILVGSGFSTYASVFHSEETQALPGAVNPGAVGMLAWRQIMQDNCADPMLLQPVYLRRDAETDWKKDHLITKT